MADTTSPRGVRRRTLLTGSALAALGTAADRYLRGDADTDLLNGPSPRIPEIHFV